MTLQEFIQQYDIPGSIVLLEGKRSVLEQDKNKLTALGALLANSTQHMLFRSGNADGSDQYFSEGVASVDYKRLQVITPYTGHRKKSNQAYDTVSLDRYQPGKNQTSSFSLKATKKQKSSSSSMLPVIRISIPSKRPTLSAIP
jgi:hypothetical protein